MPCCRTTPVDRESWATREELGSRITDDERTYHRHPWQGALGKLTPVTYEAVIGDNYRAPAV